MTALAVLGWDPSTEGSAWALLHVDGMRREFVACGEAADDGEIVAHLELFRAPGSRLVAVERPGSALHIHHEGIPAARARASCLIATSRVAGFVSGCALSRGLRVYEIAPEKWRSMVVGKSSPQDAEVKFAIQRLVSGWPTRSNSHVRDAAGVALAASILDATAAQRKGTA